MLVAHDKLQTIIDVGEDLTINAYGWPEFTAGLKRHPGKRFYLTATTKRSKNQNNTYWWWIEFICEQVGEEDKEVISNMVKAGCSFWDEYCDEGTGEIFKVLRSTANASVGEMKSLMEKMCVFAVNKWEVVLPEPDSQLRIRI